MTTSNDAEIYQHKLNEAKRLIDTHNYLRKPTRDDTRVVYGSFLQRLADMGGTSNEMLMQTTADDLTKICGLPILMSRRLEEIFQDDTISSDIRAKKDWDLSRAMRLQMDDASEDQDLVDSALEGMSFRDLGPTYPPQNKGDK